MKTKLLKYFRKYWEYKFDHKGEVLLRRKCDQKLIRSGSIRSIVYWLGLHHAPCKMFFRWEDKKERISDNRIWNSYS